MGMIGSFSGYKSGHSLNNTLLKTLLADKEAWEVVTFDKEESPIAYISPVMTAATS
jgi:UDP-3-O-[3-hydroxymyristoyl] N-acetylglucosamine deacetylase